MRIYHLISLFIIFFSTACSKYTIDNESGGGIDISIQFQKNTGGETLETEYPVRIFCTDVSGKSLKDLMFNQGDEMTFSLAKGEYGINAFVGWDEDNYILKDGPDSKQVVTMKNSLMSDKALRAAHTSLEIDKQTDINMIPAYVVASAEVELSNIPAGVKSVRIDLSPVCSGYYTCGGYSAETQNGVIECYEKSGKWVSDKKYFFPVENRKTTISVSIDKGGETDNYSYTLIDGIKAGQPYKFTGGYSDGLDMDGDFQISGWNMDKEIVLDFEDETSVGDGEDEEDIPSYDIETFIVEAIPSADVIWGPFYVWKVEEQSVNEALVTIISPDQWFQTFEKGEALELLSNYEIDEMTGWRTFTKEEVEEFHEELSGELDGLNSYLEENGHNIFYTGNRYLCENGDYAFNIFGSPNIRAAGTTVKYYLRPLKTIRLKVHPLGSK